MIKGAFLGGATAFGAGPGPLAGAGFEITAVCRGGRGGFSLPPGARELGSAGELFAEPGLQFAAISLPPAESCKAILLALERGLHVFCEPPFCLTSTEFGEIREAAETAGRTVFPAQPWERAPAYAALEKAVNRGLAGEINFAFAQALLPGPAPEDWLAAPPAWQVFSTLLGLARRPPAAVEARLSPGGPAAFHVHFGGADAFVHLSGGAFAPRLKTAVSGDKGRLELDNNLLRLDLSGSAPETVELSAWPEPGSARPEWLAAELADFGRELAGEKPRGSGLRNARYCVKLLKNARYSAGMKSAAIPL